jgi:hypothetical protein
VLEAQGGENDRSPCGTDKTGPLSSEPRPKAKRFFLKFIVVLLRGLRAVRGQEGTFCTLKMSLVALGKKVSEVIRASHGFHAEEWLTRHTPPRARGQTRCSRAGLAVQEVESRRPSPREVSVPLTFPFSFFFFFFSVRWDEKLEGISLPENGVEAGLRLRLVVADAVQGLEARSGRRG